MSALLKDRLRKVEHELGELQGRKADTGRKLEEAKTAFEGTDLDPAEYKDSAEYKALTDATRENGEVQQSIQEMTNVQVSLLRAVGEDPEKAIKPGDDNGRVKAIEPDEPKAADWSFKSFFDSDENATHLKALAGSRQAVGRIEVGEIDRDTFKTDLVGTTGMRKGAFGGIIPVQRRRLSVLDLIATGTMNNNTFPYVVEGGTYTAQETTEGSAKTESGVTLTDAEATARTIAVWKKLQKQSLEDVAALQSFIEGRLQYDVLRRLETQIISGDGIAPNLHGIIGTAGVGATAFDPDIPFYNLILGSIVDVLAADGEPNGIVLNPADWATTVSVTDDNDRPVTDPFGPMVGSVYGYPTVPSNAIAVGNALVGDFAMGAQVLIRSGVKVLISDSDQDDFVTNKITVLAELRAALPIYKPSLFSLADLAA